MPSMATSSKATAKAAIKRSAPSRPAAKPRAAAKEKAFLRFYHSNELRAKTLAVLAALEQAPDPGKHADALADVVVELTSAGMEFYFMRPLTEAKAGFIVEKSANLGLTGSVRVMGSVIRSVIGRMDGDQLLSVCGSLRELMR